MEMGVIHDLVINPEFEKLIPPLSEEEFTQLEENILAEGIRDPLVTWDRVIVDGHNRYKIAQKHNLFFDIIERDFRSEEDAKIWMYENQLGRRNLTKEQRKYFIGALYEENKKKVGAPEGNSNASNGNSSNGPDLFGEESKNNGVKMSPLNEEKVKRTRGKIAKSQKVSQKTVQRSEIYKKALDRIADAAGTEIKHMILNREIKTTDKEVLRISKLPEEKIIEIFEAIKNGETSNLKESIHKAAARNVKSTPELKPEEKRYTVIYADPPWSYGNTLPNYVDTPNDHYPTMTLKEICEMPVKEISERNAVLFLWVTSPLLPESLKVINAWGFEYKTSFVWDKVKHNMGHYNSVRHEFLFVCVRGSCPPQERKLFDSVVSIERTKHSEKPEFFREIIDTIYPNGNRIELFARVQKNNWDVFGNQISGVK